jgi:hypothetical protein
MRRHYPQKSLYTFKQLTEFLRTWNYIGHALAYTEQDPDLFQVLNAASSFLCGDHLCDDTLCCCRADLCTVDSPTAGNQYLKSKGSDNPSSETPFGRATNSQQIIERHNPFVDSTQENILSESERRTLTIDQFATPDQSSTLAFTSFTRPVFGQTNELRSVFTAHASNSMASVESSRAFIQYSSKGGFAADAILHVNGIIDKNRTM